MLNVLSWACFSSVHSSDQKLASAFRAARPSVLNISEDTVWLNLKLCPLSFQSSVTFYFHVRVRRRECMNSSACWPCRHGEHCWTVKAWVWYRLRSGLIFVSGRRDQQKDSLRVQLCHNSSDSRSLAYSSALLQAQLDLQPCFPPITTHFHSSGLLSVWKDEPMWKKNRNPYSISSCCTTERDQTNKSTDFDCLLSRLEPQPLF